MTLAVESRDGRMEILEHHRPRALVGGERRRLSNDGADQFGDHKLEVRQLFQALGDEFLVPTF